MCSSSGDSLYLDIEIIRKFTSLNAGASGPWFWDELSIGFVDLVKVVHALQVDIDFDDLVPRGIGSIEHVGKIAQALPSMSLNVPWDGFPFFVYGSLTAEEDQSGHLHSMGVQGSLWPFRTIDLLDRSHGVNGT